MDLYPSLVASHQAALMNVLAQLGENILNIHQLRHLQQTSREYWATSRLMKHMMKPLMNEIDQIMTEEEEVF